MARNRHMYLPHSAAARSGGLIAVAAAALAGAAVVVNVRSTKAERRYPPLGTFVTVKGVRLHVIESGRGSPVVFLHGNGAMVNDIIISGLLDRVSRSHRAIAFDRPGFGYSDRPRGRAWGPVEQAALLPSAFALMGIKRPIIVAHSWGTLVALALALNNPNAVAGLVLVSGYYFPTARPESVMMSPATLPLLGDAMNHTVSPLIGELMTPAMLRKMFAPEPVAPRFERNFPVALTLRPSQIRAYCEDAAGMQQAAQNLSPHYREIDCPVTIIAGDADKIVEHDQAPRLHQALAGSYLETIGAAGHMLHYAHLDRVVAAIDGMAPGEPASRAENAPLLKTG